MLCSPKSVSPRVIKDLLHLNPGMLVKYADSWALPQSWGTRISGGWACSPVKNSWFWCWGQGLSLNCILKVEDWSQMGVEANLLFLPLLLLYCYYYCYIIIFIISVNFPLLGAVLLLLLLLLLLLFLWTFCLGQFYCCCYYCYLCEPPSVGSIFIIIIVVVFAIIMISADLPLLGTLVYDLFAFAEEWRSPGHPQKYRVRPRLSPALHSSW